MSIDDQGLLSETDIMPYRDQIRQRYARYCDLMHRVHTLCRQAKCRLNSTSTQSQHRMEGCVTGVETLCDDPP